MSPIVTREEAYHRLTDLLRCKWTIAILGLLSEGCNRPSQLERSLDGLTPKVLNERLAKLMRYGLLERRNYDETPPHVEYVLTRRGEELVAMLSQLRSFAELWVTEPARIAHAGEDRVQESA
jgi:DNA-binding HxlR family transcriptional regulator